MELKEEEYKRFITALNVLLAAAHGINLSVKAVATPRNRRPLGKNIRDPNLV